MAVSDTTSAILKIRVKNSHKHISKPFRKLIQKKVSRVMTLCIFIFLNIHNTLLSFSDNHYDQQNGYVMSF